MGPPKRERRRHKRHELACPVWLGGAGGRQAAQVRSINISDGGMLLPIADGGAPRVGSQVHVDFSVPRSTPNTFLLEEFAAQGIIVRREPRHGGCQRVALAFQPPIDLALEA